MKFVVTFNSFRHLFRFSVQRVLGLRKFFLGAVEYESLWASITQQIRNNFIRKCGTDKLMFLRGFSLSRAKQTKARVLTVFLCIYKMNSEKIHGGNFGEMMNF